MFKVALVLLLGSLIGYAFQGQIISFLLAPLAGEKLVYLTPGGGFDFIFKVALYVGCAIAIPSAIYQIYRYLAPVMKRRQSRRLTATVVLLSLALAVSGMLFGYYVALPAALNFLTNFAGDYVEANLTASSYLNFVTVYSLGLAALFQLPIILLFINSINGPIKPSKLLSSERFVLVGAFILAAIITPTPDVVNQLIVAAPVMGVYQIGIILVILQNQKNKTKEVQETTDMNSGFTANSRARIKSEELGFGGSVSKTMSQNNITTSKTPSRALDGVVVTRARSAGAPRIPQRPISTTSRVQPRRIVRPVSIDGIVAARQPAE